MSDNLRGILAIVVSGAAFVVNDALMKLISSALPAGQTLFLRGVAATLLIAIIMLRLGQSMPLSTLLEPRLAARSLTTGVAAIFIVLSLQRWPLASVNAVIQVAPLCVVAGAGLIFGERVGAGRWLAALTGFFGMLLVLKPVSIAGGQWGMADGRGAAVAIVFAALALTVARDLLTRGIPRGTTPLFIAFTSSIAAAIAGTALLPIETWHWPAPVTWAQVAGSGVFTAIAYIFGIIAMRTGELSVVAPFRYFQLPIAIVLSYVVWQHVPDGWAMLGLGLILAAGLFTVALERSRRPTLTSAKT
jgi:drug/metabolite transporter (DMT)-like permease